MSDQKFIELSECFFVDVDFAEDFRKLGLVSINAVFDFAGGKNLAKSNIDKHRSRIEFHLGDGKGVVFLKRYDHPPVLKQLLNWNSHHKRASMSSFDRMEGFHLAKANINIPKTIAYGRQWGKIFEKRSFIITQKIPDAESLERKLPAFFYANGDRGHLAQKCEFIEKLANFARRFHETGLRHRDFYFAHIFLNGNGEFYLIDLQRAFKPIVFGRRFRVKDISQLYYSAPGNYFSRADRLRFYLRYAGKTKLSWRDRQFIRKIKARAWRMADHDIKHGRAVPFAM